MRRIEAEWLRSPALQSLLAALSTGGEEARIVGGAIRNELLGQEVVDVDLATTTEPDETTRRAESAEFRVVPTGVEHGTVTVVTPERAYEVTTLRQDVVTDGRHAKVRFGRDWQADAERRDFTINALYAKADGTVIDLVGGIADIDARNLRFIGDPSRRIEEDYLRILRFFRFFAWYGRGRPDADGLRASARLKSGLAGLSAERIWNELRKTLAAPDPSRALLWMRQVSVLTSVLPESEKWGIDAIPALIDAESGLGWQADPLLRLLAIVPPEPGRLAALAKRLKLSNAERDRLLAYANAEPVPLEESDQALRVRLYFGDAQAIRDRLRHSVSLARRLVQEKPETMGAAAARLRQLQLAEAFEAPRFPLGGDDLKTAGIEAGPEVGSALTRLKKIWAEDGFRMGREALLAKL